MGLISNGSTVLPKRFDIFAPVLSKTRPFEIMFLKQIFLDASQNLY